MIVDTTITRAKSGSVMGDSNLPALTTFLSPSRSRSL